MAKWTQDEGIAFECAREVIGELMAIYSGTIYDEAHKATPDAKLIAECRVERSRLAQERASLHVGDHTVIARTRADYGAIVRASRSRH